MEDTERSIWTGLTPRQQHQLTLDLRRPPRKHMTLAQAYAHVGLEYAVRVSALVAANDVREALWWADLWAYADAGARGHKRRDSEGDCGAIFRQYPAATARTTEQAVFGKAEG